MFERHDRISAPLYVVTPVFNPIRYRSRWKLYEDFALMCERAGAILYTVEVAFGDRAHVVTDSANPRHIQLRTNHELWLKENAINIGVSRLPADWKYAAWIDADVLFTRGDWADETIHQLQHYPIVQMFSQSHDLTPSYEIHQTHKSYAWCLLNDPPSGVANSYSCDSMPERPHKPRAYYWHPGYAWAIRRSALDAIGGLMDWAILGGADSFMADALSGHLTERNLPRSLGETGVRWLQNWQHRAQLAVKQNIGFVEGLMLHHWHGRKGARAYHDRGQILVKGSFDPEVDIYRDYQGLWQLRAENTVLRDGIRAYFRQRNEDSIDASGDRWV